MNIQEILYKSSPQYTSAYKDGYDYAKYEMIQMLEGLLRRVKAMEALTDTSTTTVTPKP